MKSPIYAAEQRLLTIGRLGENNAQPIVFNISDWFSQFGDGGVVALLHKRATDTEPYPCAIERNGSAVTWVPSSGDLAIIGYGEAELKYIVAGSIVKSRIWQTQTLRALEGSAEPPEPWQSYVDSVAADADRAQRAADEIESLGVKDHIDDKSIHVTTAEKEKWNKGGEVTKEAIEKALGGAVAKADYVNASFNSMHHYIDSKDATKADKTALDATNNKVEQVRANAVHDISTLSDRIDLDWADTEEHINNTDVHVTEGEKDAWNGKADASELGALKTAITEVESVAYNRSYSANAALIADNNVYDVVGIPQYLTAEMAQQYTGKTDAESGWYWFGQVHAPSGTKVEKKAFQFYGSKNAILGGQPNDGDDRIMVAIRFDALGSPVGFWVKWNSTMQRSDPFIFRCDDLAIRNLDYKTTYYVYNLEPYAVVTDEKVTFEGMTQNVTYQYKVRLDKPVEIILPQVDEEEGHGVWMELQLYFTGAFSLTLVPPEGVVVKNAPTPAISAGYNVIDLMYYNIDGVKCWRVQNTRSTF